MIRRLILMLTLSVAMPAMAADPAGIWALRTGNVTLFKIAVRHDGPGWAATWIRSADFDVDADGKFKTGGPIIKRPATEAHANPDGTVEVRFDDPRPGAIPDVFRIRAIDAHHAETYFSGGRMGVILLARATPKTRIDAWGRSRRFTYSAPDHDWPTNAEMTALFTADQADRQVPHIDWAMVGSRDQQRRSRTQQLIDAGALHSGDDFLHAAFVFQHGAVPDDFLKAHLLAMVAIARGNRGAIWIASATLDRYLQNIHQPQVLGTQFLLKPDGTTQEPYNRALISDALRQALNVPPLDEQEVQRKRYDATRKN